MKTWDFYTSRELKPEGWVRRQLEIQAKGLSGNLDKVWPDVRDSAWIGGSKEGWERVPYWLDGFIPLAYLLEDEDMISRAKKYIDAILSFQRPDGWICPCKEEDIPTYDSWAVQLISKVLTVYYDCSGDERILPALYRVLKNYHHLLKEGVIRLFGWGQYRWFETFVALDRIQEHYDEPWIGELAAILKAQGTDYDKWVRHWKRPLNKWTLYTHIVNLCMMLKSEAVSHALLGEDYTNHAETLYNVLKKYNGTPVGIFTGDECLSGQSPIQGTELCSVVELMYSFEWLFACTGDPIWAERLEQVAFNALPATLSDDMWTHQYDQMSNQMACQEFPGRSVFRTNDSRAHLFGLEPHFGCCTANFNQGWPKLALSAILHRDDTVLCALPIPMKLDTWDKTVLVSTDYPFKNHIVYEAEGKTDFTLELRIPSFAEDLTVNGTPCGENSLSVPVKAGTKTVVTVDFTTTPKLVERPHNLHAVQCGSLVFSLPVQFEMQKEEYEKNGVVRKFPYCDYQLIPTSPWAYGFGSEELKAASHPVDAVPFSSQHPPVTVQATVLPIDWGFEDGFDTVCAKVPQSTTPCGPAETVELVPYGCAKLRMTELPLIK